MAEVCRKDARYILSNDPYLKRPENVLLRKSVERRFTREADIVDVG